MPSVNDMMRKARKRSKEENERTNERFRQILGILKKYDLKAGITPDKAVALLQDLGPTFVKLGQIASTHPDMLPREYCDAFGKLRTKVDPMDFATVKSQVETELGKPLGELFTSFDETPTGSASMAQVHRATLPDGTDVAVKVQRPGIVDTVTSDLAIMERLVDLYELVDRDENGLSLKDLVAEMVRTSTDELDFRNEAANIDRFHANNQDREKVSSPRCYHNYSNSAIITEDFLDEPCVEDIDTLGLDDDAREAIAYLLASNYMQQVMVDGFYHADPHAGNVLLTGDGGIEWIDFGIMGALTTSERETLEELVTAFVKGDAYKLKRAVLKIARPTGQVDHAALLDTCEKMADQYISVDLDSFDTGALLTQMTETLNDNGFEVEPFVTNLARGLVTLEGTIHLVSSKLNIMNVLTDYQRDSFDPKRLEQNARRMADQTVESVEATTALPAKLLDTLDMIQKGQARIGMELSSNDRFSRDLRGIGGLIALALVAVGFMIGACIVGASDHAITIGGVSIIDKVGLLAGGAIAVYIIVKVHPYLK